MHAAIVLPARLASTRLPNKLLLDRSGKTVLEHTLDRARTAQAASHGLISRILVAADDPQLIAAAQRAGIDAVMTRPDHASGTDRIAEAAEKLSEDIIINLQADEPEIDPANVVLVARLLAESTGAPVSTLAVPIYENAQFLKTNVVKVIVASNGNALYFSRAPIPHVRDTEVAPVWVLNGKAVYGYHHLGLYAYRRAFLLGYKNLPASLLEKLEKLEQLRALEAGFAIKVGIVQSNPPGIDTPEDYEAFLARIKNRVVI
ncbi:MAG TPA: 3-deoxy-manno-octulosonate cytidylyltransferase [Planctomycetota bacterium]|nr:3-deoxy-manno-octulosonate cytidylyltransferase [Planctomycetota bacterium]